MTWNLLSDSYVSKQETIIDGFATKLADTSHHLNTDAVMDKDGKKDQDTGVCVCVCVSYRIVVFWSASSFFGIQEFKIVQDFTRASMHASWIRIVG